jgi:superfamily II DNA or RNA helicase
LAHETGLPVLFVVPSDYLLEQGLEAFGKYIGGITLGRFIASSRDTDADVVVTTVQALVRARKTKHYEKLRGNRLLIVDEAHHNDSAAKWREALLALDPLFTLGLSATFELSGDPSDTTSTIWLRGICGPVAYSMTLSELVELGYLMRPIVEWVDPQGPTLETKKRTPQQLYRDGIVDYMPRNEAIVRAAKRYVDMGKRVIVDLAQVRHTRLLVKMLRKDVGTKWVAGVTGSTTTSMRKKIVAAFRRGNTRVLAGTVLGEGVDIPEDDVVINGEGGSGYVSTMQRLRCLTPCRGKHKAYLVEMVDDHHPQLRKSAEKRMETYCGEEAFRFIVP